MPRKNQVCVYVDDFDIIERFHYTTQLHGNVYYVL